MKCIEIISEKLIFSDGTVIYSHHDQDCCEEVYADFTALEDTTFKDEDFSEIVIEEVKTSGIRINGYFVPCYDIQNGYYSNNLKLIIEKPNGEGIKLDITGCTKGCYE